MMQNNMKFSLKANIADISGYRQITSMDELFKNPERETKCFYQFSYDEKLCIVFKDRTFVVLRAQTSGSIEVNRDILAGWIFYDSLEDNPLVEAFELNRAEVTQAVEDYKKAVMERHKKFLIDSYKEAKNALKKAGYLDEVLNSEKQ